MPSAPAGSSAAIPCCSKASAAASPGARPFSTSEAGSPAEGPAETTHVMKPFAFVFPGQGSQAVGMLDAWGDNAAVRQTLEEASSALGEDIGRLIHEGPKERLDLTANTQPAMLAAGVACYRAWLAETKAAPEVVAGHSLGEYSALVAAEAIS